MSQQSPRSHEVLEDKSTKIDFDPLSRQVVDAAYKIHQKLGAGLLEGIYQECFCVELTKRNISFETQKPVSIFYEDVALKSTCRLDLVVENKIIIELKSVERIIPAHEAQILTYMKVSGLKAGFLINYGEPYFKKAIKRFVL